MLTGEYIIQDTEYIILEYLVLTSKIFLRSEGNCLLVDWTLCSRNLQRLSTRFKNL